MFLGWLKLLYHFVLVDLMWFFSKRRRSETHKTHLIMDAGTKCIYIGCTCNKCFWKIDYKG